MNKVLLLLGGNVGNVDETFYKSKLRITNLIGIYESAAWGVELQQNFLNQVIECNTKLSPVEILTNCLAIEIEFGRTRLQKWHARTLDIDILYFNDEIIDSENLKIPHPYIQERKFTLIPLVEKWASLLHPRFLKPQSQLLDECNDNLWVNKR
jgi:2-amino-4-hydroxy-6-hydroxymethyldihydropteridine diphosphokinase